MSKKVLAVWGSPASGKTSLSAVLARRLARKNNNVMLLSFDTCIPAFSVWVPYSEPKGSIGSLLSAVNITKEDIAAITTLHPKDERIGILAAVREENLVTYPEIKVEAAEQLLIKVRELSDFVIVDCTSNYIFDMLTLSALEHADWVVQLKTADPRGILYYSAQLPVLIGERYAGKKHIRVCSAVKEYQPVAEASGDVGSFDAVLPFNEEIENKYLTGKLFEDFYTPKGKEYIKGCDTILSIMKGGEK